MNEDNQDSIREKYESAEFLKNNSPNFIKDTATAIAASRIFSDGINYVQQSEFWNWFSDIYGDGKYIQQFLNQQPLSETTLERIKILIRARGFEWDQFINHSSLFDINQLPKYNIEIPITKTGTDIVYKNLLTGQSGIIECKASLTEGGIKATFHKMLTYDPNTKFAVNQSLHNYAVAHGMSDDRFIKVVSDNQVQSIGDRRFDDAIRGQISQGITFQGVLGNACQGAIIGAAVRIGIEAVTDYKNWKNGFISGTEYIEKIGHEGLKGATFGGTFAVINVGIQYSATALGIATPWTIPVMLVVGTGLNSIINPLFKDGKYAEHLRAIQYSASLAEGWYIFSRNSAILYEKQMNRMQEIERQFRINNMLGDFHRFLDNELEKGLN